MSILSASGIANLSNAFTRFSSASQNVVNASSTNSDPATAIVEANTAKLQADIAVKVLKVDLDIEKQAVNLIA